MLSAYTSDVQSALTAILQHYFPYKEPHYLYEPIHYTLSGGGKKIRPVLLSIVSDYAGGVAESRNQAALAVELFHIFSLVHDDIMDNDTLRRGKETVHVKWDDATAILAGDGLLAMANLILSEIDCKNYKAVIKTFNQAVLDVCEGQAFDKAYEVKSSVTIEDYLNMIRLKTACLLGASAKMGALIGASTEQEANAFYQFGIHLGLAFQIQDDILDLYADEATLGKDVGSDVKNNKKSILTVLAQSKNVLPEIATNEAHAAFVERAREALKESGVFQEAELLKNSYSEKANTFLDSLTDHSSKKLLKKLTEKLNVRKS
jgi:geranylgeranyl diphosphate synthase type II